MPAGMTLRTPCVETQQQAGISNSSEQKSISFIEEIMSSVIDELAKIDGRPSITLNRRSTQARYSINAQTGALEACAVGTPCTYSWPGKTMQEGWRFAVIVRILGHISEAIRGNYISSKRDIYYLDPVYFGSQKVVDECVDDIAFTIGVDRAALHVAAAAKGLTVGSYTVRLTNSNLVDAGMFHEGILVPRVESVQHVNISDVQWILVIEKEATFHRLATSKYHQTSAAGPGILLTGKGYPDLSTRAFLRLLSQTRVISSDQTSTPSASPPIYMLVDSDPDGMGIMSTYKYGSVAQLHENAKLNVPNVEWLGLRTSELVTGNGAVGDEALIPLTLRDRKKALAMLSRSPIFTENGPEPDWRAELQQMLMLNIKAEIEILYEREGGIEGWLDKKLLSMR